MKLKFILGKVNIMCSMLVSTFAPKKPARVYSGNSILKTKSVEIDAIEMDSLENFELNGSEVYYINFF